MRILDLCCGAGLAAMGYKMAFPDADIHGWDIEDMSSCYPFKFHRGDAFALDYEYLYTFDMIHISPPCQRYSKRTPKGEREKHPHLIPNARRLTQSAGKMYVIENVPGSGAYLQPNFHITAGGKVRYFNASFGVPSANFREVANIMSTRYSSKDEVCRTWLIPNEYQVRMKDLRQGIPPLMTWYIAVHSPIFLKMKYE